MSQEIDTLVSERRGDPNTDSKMGLALSGGGIRSATFCFGLLVALSRTRLLHRFDLLSTVSGGSYIGAMFGRLLSRARDRGELQAVLDSLGASEPRWFAWWLRANGRYLIPRGASDRLFAMAIFVRNMVAIHLELGAVALLLGVLLTAFDAAVWGGLATVVECCGQVLFEGLRWLPEWLPTPWLLLPAVAAGAVLAAAAYWVVPWVASGRSMRGVWLMLALVVGVLALLRQTLVGTPGLPGHDIRAILLGSVQGLALVWLVAIPWSRRLLRSRVEGMAANGMRVGEEMARRRLTDALVFMFKLGALIVLAGLVDRVAWFLAFEYEALANAGVILALVAAVLRALLPAASALSPQAGSTSGLLWVGRVAGYGLTFGLCAWWVSIVHLAALGAMFEPAEQVGFMQAAPVLVAIGAAAAAYLLATGGNFEFLNLSSLHTFYRARLVRSYLGAANPGRFSKPPGASPISAITPVPAELPRDFTQKAVFEPDPDDDLAMSQYRPHAFGGPVHLINVCINQTHDPRGGLFNQDRRGQMLSIASGGMMRVGLAGWQTLSEPAALSLGSWMAISGAAVAPGLGSATRGGFAALLTFAGLRLGYWWSEVRRLNVQRPGARLAAKSRALLNEVFGNFDGATGRDWFLSDGGHFENTGVYALLAEKAALIVVADCGADPLYAFNDLENLVRKARIDLGAEIHFLKPNQALPISELSYPALAAFGSLNELASKNSEACLSLARVVYRDGKPGLMIVVKPNLCPSLPVDLLNFAAANPDFPQQTTADQFFDEAQWESYYQLGKRLGEGLTPDFIDALQSGIYNFFSDDLGVEFDGAPLKSGEAPASESRQAVSLVSRLPSRLRANVVSASIGLGGLVSLGLPLWHEFEKVFDAEAARKNREEAILEKLGGAWGKLPPPNVCNPAAAARNAVAEIGGLAEVLLRHVPGLCGRDYSGRFVASIRVIYGDSLAQCKLLPLRYTPGSCLRLLEAVEAQRLDGSLSGNCALGNADEAAHERPPLYWAYEYHANGAASLADVSRRHPSDPDRQATLMRLVQNRKLAEEELSREPCVPPSTVAVKPPAPPANGGARSPIQGPSVLPAPLPSPVPLEAAPAQVCAGKTIYLQIYGPEKREAVRAYREPWRKSGASVPPIEDVAATAARKGRAEPRPPVVTTVRYHDAASKACAEVLGTRVGAEDWRVEPLAPTLAPTPGVIEVWVP